MGYIKKENEVDRTLARDANFISEKLRLFLTVKSINLNLHLNYNTIDELSNEFTEFLNKISLQEVVSNAPVTPGKPQTPKS